MRHALNPQLQIGETLISDIQFDSHSRDDIPQMLRGLQHLYNDAKNRDAILEQFGTVINEKTDPETGRPGMTLWSPARIIDLARPHPPLIALIFLLKNRHIAANARPN